MSITTIVCSPHELRDELIPIMQEEFAVSFQNAQEAFDGMLNEYFSRLREGLQFVIEYPYVDKIYRDSYYAYFSSKRRLYQKNCIRISVFEDAVLPDQFRNAGGIAGLRERYRGFMVLRPTMPYIIGRNVLSPLALQERRFLSLMGRFPTTVNAVRFDAMGFPHASQDTETITCAETSLWAVMEYFASRYPEYKPIVPSAIIDTLKSRSSSRQIPSDGLNIEQMSFALREFGFGTMTYDRSEYSPASFDNLLAVYVESGIPLIVAVSNVHRGGSIRHAVVIVGRSETTEADIDQLTVEKEDNETLLEMMKRKNISIIDNADIKRHFVFIDDNYPAYQMAPLQSPMAYYQDATWKKCEIIQLLVPLYPKVYMDGIEARKCIKKLLSDKSFRTPAGAELFIRVFLTSSRSYKDYLTVTDGFSGDAREIILEIPMPKFIWVGEISSKELI
ncbi:hypothetical protein HHL17_21880 [Chitinophaga sp. G-6-1-13]|uniref:Uncharacterized protein n=1 Tax=Chitinophaga fulva TaxID=2728842 RepID=A0A848GMM7_9BACT|nr:hypothetical protein [Chitinophaga fulva]NML39865.1 hypothetical protein [Chitinophaga fulva]